MQYRDKTTGRLITLQPANDSFLVITKSADSEGVHPTLLQNAFNVVRSSNKDNIFVLRPRTSTETLVQLQADIEKIKADPTVKSVNPGLLDDAGNVNFALPDRVTVQFREIDVSQVQKIVGRLKGKINRKFRSPGLYEVTMPTGISIADFIESLNALDKVAYAEPSFYGVDDSDIAIKILEASTASGEAEELASGNLAWNLKVIDVEGAWQFSRGSSDILVIVADGLPQIDHESLAGKILAPPDDSLHFSSDLSISSHSTNVFSTVAGESARMSGVAPQGHVLPVVINLNSQVYAERADALREVAQLA